MFRKAIASTTRLWISGLLLCGATVLNGSAQAQFFDGDELLRVCSAKENSAVFSPGVCSGYIMGVIDGLECQGGEPEPGKQGFSVQENASISELVDTVLAYLKAHPERHNDWAGILIRDALRENFPCR
jgi:hypothetical protein